LNSVTSLAKARDVLHSMSCAYCMSTIRAITWVCVERKEEKCRVKHIAVIRTSQIGD